jgi:hypothetical protein
MGHEDAVYLAKLAEQAERYEGKCPPPASTDLLANGWRHQRWSTT